MYASRLKIVQLRDIITPITASSGSSGTGAGAAITSPPASRACRPGTGRTVRSSQIAVSRPGISISRVPWMPSAVKISAPSSGPTATPIVPLVT